MILSLLNPFSKIFSCLFSLVAIFFVFSADSFAQEKNDEAVRIIFRGDDMGISHSANQAIIQAYKYGVQKTAEVIVPGPWFPEAVRLLNENPGLDVGVHLALTSEWENLKWRPITYSPSLTDSLGYFYPFIWPHEEYGESRALLGQNWKLEEVERELRTQIELAKANIRNLTHLTAHMGMSNMTPEVTDLFKKLAAEYNLDIDPEEQNIRRIRFEGSPNSGEEKISRIIEKLRGLKPGNYLLVTHPDLDEPATRALSHKGNKTVAQNRQADTDMLTSKRIQEVIDELGIEVISYSDLLEFKD
jgi:predicted glycoside hydrolase/deacetylase ChbG (UPF0249 family)